jgi:hypothetical protein
MTDFIDPYPNLPQVIDIGGDRYFMGPQKPIELAFKSRKDYIDSFGKDTKTEYLLRRYMYVDIKPKKEVRFDKPQDKTDLITILKKRATQLKTSSEFTSSLLKNTIFQRSYLNIQKLIAELENRPFQGPLAPLKMPDIDILPCTRAKKYVKEIPENRLYEMIFEIAWYLLHPEQVPSQIQCDWAKLVKGLDTLRISDIIGSMQEADKDAGKVPAEPYNYFKKINIANFVKSDKDIKTALDQAIEIAKKSSGESANEDIKKRLQVLLNILQVKKYLADDLPEDAEKMKIIDSDAAKKIESDMLSNPKKPISGGGTQALDKPIGIAMQPMYDYFKVVYDPIYSLLDTNLSKYAKNNSNTKKVVIPQLTTILHICNNLKPSESTEGGNHTYGIYRITNVDEEIISFFNKMLSSTNEYVSKFQDDKNKNTFNKQLFELPKVRLSSLLNKFLNSGAFLDPESIPYIQFFTVGGNINLMTKEEKDKKSDIKEETFTAVDDFFKPNDLYILCTKSDNISENIPMNLYEINYDEISPTSTSFKIDNLPENYFNKDETKKLELRLENLVKISPYVVFNDAELALSIFILFKYLLPV